MDDRMKNQKKIDELLKEKEILNNISNQISIDEIIKKIKNDEIINKSRKQSNIDELIQNISEEEVKIKK